MMPSYSYGSLRDTSRGRRETAFFKNGRKRKHSFGRSNERGKARLETGGPRPMRTGRFGPMVSRRSLDPHHLAVFQNHGPRIDREPDQREHARIAERSRAPRRWQRRALEAHSGSEGE